MQISVLENNAKKQKSKEIARSKKRDKIEG